MFEVSVVLVSDHAAGETGGHEDLRRTLGALARQTWTGPAEFLLVENETMADRLPDGILAALPGLRIVTSPATESYALKNAGMRAAQADIAVILDADCRPAPDWLARIMEAWRANPDALAISGHTEYESGSVVDRSLALLGRGFLNPGGAGETEFVSNNNAAWRRKVYVANPLPEGLGPFAARLQSESIRRNGGKLYFDPRIRVIHEFEGWPMEADIRRNLGYGTVITRLHDSRMPYAWLVRLGRAAIPLIAAGKLWNSWCDCFRCHRDFGLRTWEVPVALALAPWLAFMETPGMWAAYGRQASFPTEYR